MNLIKYFEEAFKTSCFLTPHAVKRISQRFLASELSQLKLLVQASLRNSPLNTWSQNEETVLIDPRFNFSILCSYSKDDETIKIITFIRGKTPEAYKDCKKITVSILKEKSDQEVDKIKKLKFR